jgi:hypothetical protein
MLADARDGKPIRRSVTLTEPSNHTQDYDRALQMLEMSVDDMVILDTEEFEHFVLDTSGPALVDTGASICCAWFVRQSNPPHFGTQQQEKLGNLHLSLESVQKAYQDVVTTMSV